MSELGRSVLWAIDKATSELSGLQDKDVIRDRAMEHFNALVNGIQIEFEKQLNEVLNGVS